MTTAKVSSIIDIEELKAEKRLTAKVCSIENCSNVGKWDSKCKDFYLSKDMCAKHYMRFRVHGNPNTILHIMGEDRQNHPLYSTYRSMLSRCSNPNNPDFRNYGGRGISVANEWKGASGFSQFISDMGNKPEGMSLDRKKVNGNYCKENCKWSSTHEQGANKRNSNKTVGVAYNKNRNNWNASLMVNSVYYRKAFKNEQEAIAYRMELEKKYL